MGLVLVYGDLALAARGATIANAPSADADYPASNLLHPDREVVTRTAASPGSLVDYDIDLGATPSPGVSGFGLCNMRSDAPDGLGPDITVLSSATGFSSMGTVATLLGASFWSSTKPVRDWITVLGAIYPHRYWRVRFSTGGYRFSWGKALVGIGVDLGIFYSPDSEVGMTDPSIDRRTMDARPSSVTTGEAYRTYRLRFDEVDDATFAVWERIVQERLPFGMVDARTEHHHCRITAPRELRGAHRFGINPNLWTFDLQAEGMA